MIDIAKGNKFIPEIFDKSKHMEISIQDKLKLL
jgi:hypothetical protein